MRNLQEQAQKAGAGAIFLHYHIIQGRRSIKFLTWFYRIEHSDSLLLMPVLWRCWLPKILRGTPVIQCSDQEGSSRKLARSMMRLVLLTNLSSSSSRTHSPLFIIRHEGDPRNKHGSTRSKSNKYLQRFIILILGKKISPLRKATRNLFVNYRFEEKIFVVSHTWFFHTQFIQT